VNAVLWRELRVSARRKRIGWLITCGLWLCLLLVAVVSDQIAPSVVGPSRAPAGRILAGVLLVTLSMLVAVVAPFVAGRALAGEQRRRMFDVLIITPLTARDILRGKLLGALLPVFAILGATLPLAMLLRLYGGFTAWQVLVGYLFLFQETLVFGLAGVAAPILGAERPRLAALLLTLLLGVVLFGTAPLDSLLQGGILWWLKLPVVAGVAIWVITDTSGRLSANRRDLDDASGEARQAVIFFIFVVALAFGLAWDIGNGGPTLRYFNPVLAMASLTRLPIGVEPARGNFVVSLILYVLLPGTLFPVLATRLQRYFNTDLPYERGIFF